ncbi:MAG: glutamine--fructose-6-phosphate transaminase (isomerizing) [Candidatus Hydrogenedentes bacterium]|nr:glutamine--fructose-6-phosphate transaminase (isomerizing) [Candidatus Hydrogenedentota bacterium]
MCGIVGYAGSAYAQDIILDGLKRLEYRGYDSAGMAVLDGDRLQVRKRAGKLARLVESLTGNSLPGSLGVGHTRWATHGEPNETNAHPHLSADGRIAVVHNGIVENASQLRHSLEAEGIVFRSGTDTEVLAHLIARHYAGNLPEAVARCMREAEGAMAICVVMQGQGGLMVGARRGSPLIVGLGDGEMFIASDVPTILSRTRRVIYLEEGDICTLRRDRCDILDAAGAPVERLVVEVTFDSAAAEKEGYPHFMLKEIHQQPSVVSHQILTYAGDRGGHISLPGLIPLYERMESLNRIVIVACGTAWHAGIVGKYLIERFARVPVEVEMASEFRYGDRVLDDRTLVLLITQSGETADTVEAMRMAKRSARCTLAIVNVEGSTIAREADAALFTHAGPEVGVASTKGYTSQLSALALFALDLAGKRNVLCEEELCVWLDRLRAIPDMMERCISRRDAVRNCARKPVYRDALHAMFIGRGFGYASALEGALKLKEISYIHVEGYAAGEMKHGPIALVTDALPVICIATRDAVHSKMLSNMQEIKARGGQIIGIVSDGDTAGAELCNDVFFVPECPAPFSPLLAAIPLQLFAYYVADALGRDVDQPRNLAKSVTVE